MRAARFVFFLLLAAIPIQLGKHFWPEFSFVHGIRIDYLSPTLYLTDILIIILFVFSIGGLRRKAFHFFTGKLFISAVAAIVIGLVFAIERGAVIFGLIKFLEFSYLSFYVAQTFQDKDRSLVAYVLTMGGLVTTVILTFQLFAQSSLGGQFYYLGERTFSVATPGIATFHFLGQLILRPYATFPHPNVAAFYLLVPFVFLLFTHIKKGTVLQSCKVIALIVLALGITITFSRLVILAAVIISVFRYYAFARHYKYISIAVLTLIFLGVMTRLESNFLMDIGYRIELIGITISIFLKNPLFGTGLLNFFYYEVELQKTITPVLLQPVHNIYFYWAVMTGIVGSIPAGIFVYRLYKKITAVNSLKKETVHQAGLLVGYVLIAGMFDHYFLTLQQGQLIAAILLGLLFSGQTKDLG